jgi:hypothetical protein
MANGIVNDIANDIVNAISNFIPRSKADSTVHVKVNDLANIYIFIHYYSTNEEQRITDMDHMG